MWMWIWMWVDGDDNSEHFSFATLHNPAPHCEWSVSALLLLYVKMKTRYSVTNQHQLSHWKCSIPFQLLSWVESFLYPNAVVWVGREKIQSALEQWLTFPQQLAARLIYCRVELSWIELFHFCSTSPTNYNIHSIQCHWSTGYYLTSSANKIQGRDIVVSSSHTKCCHAPCRSLQVKLLNFSTICDKSVTEWQRKFGTFQIQRWITEYVPKQRVSEWVLQPQAQTKYI